VDNPEINFETIIRAYVKNYMKHLSSSCMQLFIVIASHTFGHLYAVKPINTLDLITECGLNRRTVMTAAKTLQEAGLIEVAKSTGGRRHQHGFCVTAETMPTVLNKLGKINLVNFGTIHGFPEHDIISSPSPGQPVPPSAVASATPSQSVKISKPKRSVDEKEAHAEVWKLFETAHGSKLTGSLQGKSIWEMIDKAKAEHPFNWKEYLLCMVETYFMILLKKPKGLECVSSQPALPHILNGEKIWLRVQERVPKTTTSLSPDLSKAEIYKIREGF
jgi:hypothetical protein